MARINKIKDYEVKSGDIFFFDNNIWTPWKVGRGFPSVT